MKNIGKLFLSSILSLGLISCSSCAKKDQVMPAPTPSCTGSSCPLSPPPPVSTDQVFTGDDWELTVPVGWEKTPNEDTNIKVYVANSVKSNLIIFIKEGYSGTYDQYALMTIRELKTINARLISAKQVEVNGTKYVLIESDRGGISLWLWITVKNGNAYALSCGGRTQDDWNQDICVTVSNSLKLK